MRNLVRAARVYRTARARERDAWRALEEAVGYALADGMTETQAAEVAGINRSTVRRIAGKQ